MYRCLLVALTLSACTQTTPVEWRDVEQLDGTIARVTIIKCQHDVRMNEAEWLVLDGYGQTLVFDCYNNVWQVLPKSTVPSTVKPEQSAPQANLK